MPHIVDHLQSEGRLQGGQLIVDLATQATAASTLSLTSASASNQFFTGTTAGQLVNLPNATQLRLGTTYYIWNNSTQSIAVRDNGGNLLRTVLADTVAKFICTSVGTANGSWVHLRELLTQYAADAVDANTTTTTSVTDGLLASMTQTPPRGVYQAIFGTSVLNSNNGAQRTFFSIYVGGVQVTGSEQAIGTGGGAYQSVSMQATVSVNGSQAIEIQWRVAGGTSTCLGRILSCERVN